jgi:hypothetical protein
MSQGFDDNPTNANEFHTLIHVSFRALPTAVEWEDRVCTCHQDIFRGKLVQEHTDHFPQ